ncbi:hypothetical protein GALMADRAFT_143752 [Galerina marginata CBS 339.88]|uniref:Secreted protein n=1 Tax=Galerina marginata (strain CBS 339.88) TaxID=685588 RepID=A0A067SNA3_GALM3|nr:hypothetical protein GALMADRAFT_143752 [Galerina marginata CBS 339.88]
MRLRLNNMLVLVLLVGVAGTELAACLGPDAADAEGDVDADAVTDPGRASGSTEGNGKGKGTEGGTSTDRLYPYPYRSSIDETSDVGVGPRLCRRAASARAEAEGRLWAWFEPRRGGAKSFSPPSSPLASQKENR